MQRMLTHRFKAGSWVRQQLIKHVSAAHTRICYSSVSPLQEACAVGFEQAEASRAFGKRRFRDMKGKMDRFNEVWG